jgi:hypothetical protein
MGAFPGEIWLAGHGPPELPNDPNDANKGFVTDFRECSECRGHGQPNGELTRMTTRMARIAPGAAQFSARKHNDTFVFVGRRAQSVRRNSRDSCCYSGQVAAWPSVAAGGLRPGFRQSRNSAKNRVRRTARRPLGARSNSSDSCRYSGRSAVRAVRGRWRAEAKRPGSGRERPHLGVPDVPLGQLPRAARSADPSKQLFHGTLSGSSVRAMSSGMA